MAFTSHCKTVTQDFATRRLYLCQELKLPALKKLGLHSEMGLSSILSGVRTIYGTDQHNHPVISISEDT